MGLLLFPLMIVLVTVPGPPIPAEVLADFSRFQRAQDSKIAVLDQTGIERLGRLMRVSDSDLTLQFGSTTHTFEKADIFSADRLRDSNKDGVVKGALFGLLMGLFAAQGLDSTEHLPAAVAASITVYGGVGYVLDRAHVSRSPLYRAPAAPTAPTVTMKLRF